MRISLLGANHWGPSASNFFLFIIKLYWFFHNINLCYVFLHIYLYHLENLSLRKVVYGYYFVNRKVKKLFNFNFFYHVVLHSLYSIKLLWYLSSVFNSLVRCTYTIIIPPQLESVSHNTLNSNVYIHESGKTK